MRVATLALDDLHMHPGRAATTSSCLRLQDPDWQTASFRAFQAGAPLPGVDEDLQDPLCDMTWLPDSEAPHAPAEGGKKKAPAGEAHKRAQRKYRERQKASTASPSGTSSTLYALQSTHSGSVWSSGAAAGTTC